MEKEDRTDRSPALERALTEGYRAAVLIARAERRASEKSSPAVFNELANAGCAIGDALFAVEEALDEPGSAYECEQACGTFVGTLRDAAGEFGPESVKGGILRDGIKGAESALESLKGIVDGYLSLSSD